MIKPGTMMTVTLTAEQWQIVERALIELPFRIAQPIVEPALCTSLRAM